MTTVKTVATSKHTTSRDSVVTFVTGRSLTRLFGPLGLWLGLGLGFRLGLGLGLGLGGSPFSG